MGHASMQGARIIRDWRLRRMARFMLLFGAVFAAVPFMIPGENRGYRFDAFWWAWWSVLLVWTLVWLVLFVRNPRFFMIILDGRLIWGDELSPSVNGSVDLVRVRELLTESKQLGGDRLDRYYVILDDGTRRELSRNAMIFPLDDLLAEMQLVNPRIRLREDRIKS